MILWRDAGVVERGGLENRYPDFGIGGSNPPLSARFTGGVAVPMNKSGRGSDGRETVSAPGSEGPKPANAEIVAAER